MLIGLIILVVLLYHADIKAIKQTILSVGISICWLFPVSVFSNIFNTLSLSIYLNHQVPFTRLLYIQMIGDNYNAIIPLAGIGGEFYKMNQLTNWVGVNVLSEAMLRNQLTLSIGGSLMTAITTGIVVFYRPLDKAVALCLTGAALFLLLIALLTGWAIFSDNSSKWLGKLLKKFKLIDGYQHTVLPKKKFFIALAYRMIGGVASVFSTYILFQLLGMMPTFLDVITVVASTFLGSAFFFVIPQGIGIFEASTSGAFKLIGYSTTMALSFGFISRIYGLLWLFSTMMVHYIFLAFQLRASKRKL